jgi:hypothetical protein
MAYIGPFSRPSRNELRWEITHSSRKPKTKEPSQVTVIITFFHYLRFNLNDDKAYLNDHFVSA